jgi:hypothetical protein
MMEAPSNTSPDPSLPPLSLMSVSHVVLEKKMENHPRIKQHLAMTMTLMTPLTKEPKRMRSSHMVMTMMPTTLPTKEPKRTRSSHMMMTMMCMTPPKRTKEDKKQYLIKWASECTLKDIVLKTNHGDVDSLDVRKWTTQGMREDGIHYSQQHPHFSKSLPRWGLGRI